MRELKIFTGKGKAVNPFRGTIYLGLKEGYDGRQHSYGEALKVIQEFVDEIGLCVTVKETLFVYKDGNEQGLEIGFINYPRFPEERITIKHKALALADCLRHEFKQKRVSVVFDDETIMLEDDS